MSTTALLIPGSAQAETGCLSYRGNLCIEDYGRFGIRVVPKPGGTKESSGCIQKGVHLIYFSLRFLRSSKDLLNQDL